jgi:hypothetical protein
MDFETGRKVGPWTLNRFLGEGGNAEVWAATREGEVERAVKVLRDRRTDAVAYGRFRREIEGHRQIGGRRDVVPMLDWDLPEELGRRERAWLSMPIAQPVRDALVGQPLETVVGAVASFASTLADLQRAHDIAHRDVKPGNLYRFEDAWAVGDLGLIDLPGAETLTAPGRVVGPANFVAYEMMVSPATADPNLADVYSLAKTLWVLAADQEWPPPGNQPAGDQLYSIGAYRPHARVSDLDRLVDLCTRRPEERPSLSSLASELTAWLDPPEMPDDQVDLGDLAARIGARLGSERARKDLEQQRLDLTRADAELLAELLDPLVRAVAEVAPEARQTVREEATPAIRVLPEGGQGRVVAQWPHGLYVAGPGLTPMMFDLATLVAALDDGQMQLGGTYLVKQAELIGSRFMKVYGPWRLEAGSAASRRAIYDLVADMRADLPAALEAFAEALN